VTTNVNVTIKAARMEHKLCTGQHALLTSFTKHKNIKFISICLNNLLVTAMAKITLSKILLNSWEKT
jgi:hypothetical protein